MPAKLPDGAGKRHSLGFRTTREIKDAVVAAAQAAGRSVAQEIELRLEISFREQTEIRERQAIADVIRGEMRREFAAQRAEAEGLPLPNMSEADRRDWLS